MFLKIFIFLHISRFEKKLLIFTNFGEKENFEKNGIILDPHTAVGVGAAHKLSFNDCVVLSTAHPCKFPAATDNAINYHEELPSELQYVHGKEENFQLLKNDTDE